MSTPETERVRRIWEKLAPKYDKLIVSGEVAVRRRPRLGLLAGDWKRPGDRRRNGSELRALPRGRPADGNRSQRVHGWNCKRTAESLGRQADLRVGDAQALDFPPGRFDPVFCPRCL